VFVVLVSVAAVVGLPDAAVKESRDRVTTAVANSGYRWSRGRMTINLAPADIKKEGPSFDLPIALGMIAVSEEIDTAPFADFSFVGELTDDDLQFVEGKQEELLGRIQKRTGETREAVEKAVKEACSSCGCK
jgi:predicted ATPase with chaperone activity